MEQKSVDSPFIKCNSVLIINKNNSLDLKLLNSNYNKSCKKLIQLNKLTKNNKNLLPTTFYTLIIVQLVLTSLTIISAFHIYLTISDVYKTIENECALVKSKFYIIILNIKIFKICFVVNNIKLSNLNKTFFINKRQRRFSSINNNSKNKTKNEQPSENLWVQSFSKINVCIFST